MTKQETIIAMHDRLRQLSLAENAAVKKGDYIAARSACLERLKLYGQLEMLAKSEQVFNDGIEADETRLPDCIDTGRDYAAKISGDNPPPPRRRPPPPSPPPPPLGCWGRWPRY